jgi:hypothetical protein
VSARAPGAAAAHLAREAAELVHHDRAAPATVGVEGHGRRDRVRRALLALAACWGAAIGAVFLPVLHFVLVPALLLAGPVVAFARLRQKLTLLDVDGACPACGFPVHEPLRADAGARIEIRCEGCRRALALRLPAHLLAAG